MLLIVNMVLVDKLRIYSMQNWRDDLNLYHPRSLKISHTKTEYINLNRDEMMSEKI